MTVNIELMAIQSTLVLRPVRAFAKDEVGESTTGRERPISTVQESSFSSRLVALPFPHLL